MIVTKSILHGKLWHIDYYTKAMVSQQSDLSKTLVNIW